MPIRINDHGGNLRDLSASQLFSSPTGSGPPRPRYASGRALGCPDAVTWPSRELKSRLQAPGMGPLDPGSFGRPTRPEPDFRAVPLDSPPDSEHAQRP